MSPVGRGLVPRRGAFTQDRLERFDLSIRQPRDGFRFGLDAMLLADAVRLDPGETAVELGAGCGVVSLILSRLFPEARAIIAIEAEESMALLALDNARSNRARVHVIRANYARLHLTRPVDVVFGNPPYFPAESGSAPRGVERLVATREIRATMSQTVEAAARLVAPAGRVTLIYHPTRRDELSSCLKREGLKIARWTSVRVRAEGPLCHVIVEARKIAVAHAEEREMTAESIRDR